jgi:ankyrin repeat protein
MYQDVDSVNELIRSGKWVDKPDGRGVTPIMIAAERGDLRVAEALLRGGANPRRAVAVAEKRHDAEMVQLLKRYAGR